MIRRLLPLVAVTTASLTACSDITPPTNSRATPTPSRPSLAISPLIGPDITFDVPGGSIRIYDTKIVAPEGRVDGGTAFVNPGAAMTFTGKWEVVANTCGACATGLFLSWTPYTNGFVALAQYGVAMNVGNNGTFQIVSTAPMDVRDYYIILLVGSPEFPGSYGPGGRPTGGEGSLYEPFAINVTNDDVTGPVITAQLPSDSTAYGWYKNNVSGAWNVSDSKSDVTGTTNCGSFTVVVDGAESFTCEATSAGGKTSKTVTVKRDATPPQLSPAVVPSEVLVGGSATASPNATDNLSQIASASCGPVSTSTPGAFTVQCTATDKAGNTTTASANYVVKAPFAFGGFQSPIKSDIWNSAKAGAAVAVKFSLGGNKGLNILAAGYPTSKDKACPSASTPSTTVTDASTSANAGGLQYDSRTDTYTYVWKTDKSWAGKCRTFVLKLTDGVDRTADFQFKK